jgi:hypothetical protein
MFYFKQIAGKNIYKLVAFKGDMQPNVPELGAEYSIDWLQDLVNCGCQVIMIPAFSAFSSTPGVVDNKGVAPTMRYAKGYRGPQLGDKVDYANLSDYYLGFHSELPRTRCQEDIGTPYPYGKTVVTPSIGPLPPQAPLAPVNWTPETGCLSQHAEFSCTLLMNHEGCHEAHGRLPQDNIYKTWSGIPIMSRAPVQEMDAAPVGTMLNPAETKLDFAVQVLTTAILAASEPENSTWWTRIKECFDWS